MLAIKSKAKSEQQHPERDLSFFDHQVDDRFWGDDDDEGGYDEADRYESDGDDDSDVSFKTIPGRFGSIRPTSKTALRIIAGVTVLALLGVVIGTSRSQADGQVSGVDPVTGYPWCDDAASDMLGDAIGDGYGWENNRSCRVRVAGRPADAPARIDTLTGYPWCENPASDFVGDAVGDGYGWEYDETCRVGSNPVLPAPPTTRAPVAPPTTRSPISDPAPEIPGGGPTTTEPFKESPPTEAPLNPSTSTPAAPMPHPAPEPGAPAPTHGGPHDPTTTAAPHHPETPDPTHDDPGHPGHPMPPQPDGSAFESMRNDDPKFSQYENTPSNQLSIDALTFHTNNPDNGSVGDGQFRAACEYSHFSHDDPIIHPGQPGASHLHMFFGNTRTNAHTNNNTLINTGGSTCNGYELNRSAYWTPALLDGKGNAIVPDQIILYYKTKQPHNVQPMPQGLKMVAGNTTSPTFTQNQNLHWACGNSGESYNRSNTIPNCNGNTINAVIVFPNCWDGKNLDSPNHQTHLKTIDENHNCPNTHPVRLPQISILLYFPGGNTNGWHLSSDAHHNAAPGSTLHADWYGAWNNQTMDLWTNGCMKAARNCSYGQTGTNRQLAKLNGHQTYNGPNTIPLP